MAVEGIHGWGRGSFFPVVLGISSDTDVAQRVVLVNPITQATVILHGNVTEFLASQLPSTAAAPPPPPPPASKASIDSMKTVVLVEEENQQEEHHHQQECPVCLEGLVMMMMNGKQEQEEAAVVKEMGCGHRFHGFCIQKWLAIHASCPVCRFQMS